MHKPDALDYIISQINPEQVPVEFIVMAKITTLDGVEHMLSGHELELVMANPEQYNVAAAQIILNVKKIRHAITVEADEIFAHVRAMDA